MERAPMGVGDPSAIWAGGDVLLSRKSRNTWCTSKRVSPVMSATVIISAIDGPVVNDGAQGVLWRFNLVHWYPNVTYSWIP